MEMPEFVQFASLLQQQRAEQIIDIPVPRGRRGGWWRSPKFSPKTRPSTQIVDTPVRSGGLQGFRPGQVSTASSSLPRSADEAVEGVFRTFPRFQKSAESGNHCGGDLACGVSTLGSHQMSRAGVAAHLSSSRPAFQQPSPEAAVAFDVVEYVECGSRWCPVPVGTGLAAALLVAGRGGRVPAWQGHLATLRGRSVRSGQRRLQGLLPGHGSAAFCGADLR